MFDKTNHDESDNKNTGTSTSTNTSDEMDYTNNPSESRKNDIEKNIDKNEKAFNLQKSKSGIKKIAIIASLAVVIIVTLMLFSNSAEAKRADNYTNGINLANSKDYEVAISAFENAGNYNDSVELLKKIGDEAYSSGNYSLAYNAWNTITEKIISENGGNQKLINVFAQYNNLISCGNGFTVRHRNDGTVEAVGSNEYGQCSLIGWNNIKALAAGCSHTVGLRNDGTIVASGDNESGQLNVSGWKNIVAISAGMNNTIGLRSDGTVVAVGNNFDEKNNVSEWKNIVEIAAGLIIQLALKVMGQ